MHRKKNFVYGRRRFPHQKLYDAAVSVYDGSIRIFPVGTGRVGINGVMRGTNDQIEKEAGMETEKKKKTEGRFLRRNKGKILYGLFILAIVALILIGQGVLA